MVFTSHIYTFGFWWVVLEDQSGISLPTLLLPLGLVTGFCISMMLVIWLCVLTTPPSLSILSTAELSTTESYGAGAKPRPDLAAADKSLTAAGRTTPLVVTTYEPETAPDPGPEQEPGPGSAAVWHVTAAAAPTADSCSAVLIPYLLFNCARACGGNVVGRENEIEEVLECIF